MLEPRLILFGDTIEASVDVLLDRAKVDPASVRVSTEFLPWEIVGPQVRVRSDAGSNTYLQTTFTLRCTGSPCLPVNDVQRARVRRSARLVRAAAVGAAPGARAVDSRSTARSSSSTRGSRRRISTDRRRRAPSRGAPISSRSRPRRTGSRPRVLLVVLLVLAAVLVAAGAALAFVAIPRRRTSPSRNRSPSRSP